MQFIHKTMLAMPLLIAAPAAVPHMLSDSPLAAHERSTLTVSAPELESLRAGASASALTLSLDERATLRYAQQNAGDLESLRAGALSDRELMWLLIGVAIVILIIAL